jgi:hypothetical protein
MSKNLFLVIDKYAGTNKSTPEQFFFAEDAAEAFELFQSKFNDEDHAPEDVQAILINVEAGIVAVYVYNSNMEDWDDIDTTEVIVGTL